MFSLLWSEHCAYKHSRKLLRRLPTEGERVVMGPGENAGAVDVGNGYAVAFKVESHNHPSAVEPFQGAATGVGGILRDVFAIGARPIAILDSLRFGELDSVRSRHLLDGAVRGIGHYGNSIGVADRRRRDLLRGALRAQLPGQRDVRRASRKTEDMVRAAAAGVGNAVVLMGASTGRDGIGGASVLASAELGEGDEAKRPTVQIGDPFEESKVLECCLELLEKGLLVSLQDLGAAGLTSSAGEMASAGGVGIDIDVARVPLREADMEPFEIMVSESQERMLGGGRAGAGSPRCWRSARNGRPARPRSASSPTAARCGSCAAARSSARCRSRRWSTAARSTTSSRPSRRAGSTATGRRWRAGASRRGRRCWRCSPPPASPPSAGPSSSTTRWSARARCGGPESADAAVLQLPEAGNAIAVSIDGNGRRVACDPYAGTIEAVLECAQNLACVGAEPLGLTNCLNFGNPEKPAAGLAARPRRQRPRRRLQGARRPRRRRQRLPLQRGAGRPDLPDPGGRHGRRAARPRPGRRQRLRQRGRRDRPARPLRTHPRRLGAGEAARRARRRACRSPTSPRSPPPARPSATRSAPASSPPPTTSATAASPAPWPSRAIAGGVGCRVDLQPLRERGCSPEEALFGEGAGGFLLSGERAALEALGATPARRGRRHARSRSPPATAASPSASATAESAWRSLGERLDPSPDLGRLERRSFRSARAPRSPRQYRSAGLAPA